MNSLKMYSDENYLSELNTITKMVITLFFSVFTVFMDKEGSLLFLFVVSCIYVIPLKKYKIMIFGYSMILIMFFISLGFSYLLGIVAKKYGVDSNFKMLIPFLRVAFMLNLMIAFTMSSGVKKIVNILKTIRMPRFLFLPLIVIFRFVPSFMYDIKQIHESIRIKMGSFNFITMITKPALFIRLMVIPTVVRALRSAEELSAAAELKGISGNSKITNSLPENWGKNDVIVIFLSITITIISLILNSEKLKVLQI